MKAKDELQTSNGEMVTISRAEYEEFQAQSQRISELESRVEMLMEALLPLRRATRQSWSR